MHRRLISGALASLSFRRSPHCSNSNHCFEYECFNLFEKRMTETVSVTN